ncbi:hypothetical protein DIPPA_08883 [Diplonema papillatum]|nr:hypothetical protein DIPPA_08883 [Diplonema papillatum]
MVVMFFVAAGIMVQSYRRRRRESRRVQLAHSEFEDALARACAFERLAMIEGYDDYLNPSTSGARRPATPGLRLLAAVAKERRRRGPAEVTKIFVSCVNAGAPGMPACMEAVCDAVARRYPACEPALATSGSGPPCDHPQTVADFMLGVSSDDTVLIIALDGAAYDRAPSPKDGEEGASSPAATESPSAGVVAACLSAGASVVVLQDSHPAAPPLVTPGQLGARRRAAAPPAACTIATASSDAYAVDFTPAAATPGTVPCIFVRQAEGQLDRFTPGAFVHAFFDALDHRTKVAAQQPEGPPGSAEYTYARFITTLAALLSDRISDPTGNVELQSSTEFAPGDPFLFPSPVNPPSPLAAHPANMPVFDDYFVLRSDNNSPSDTTTDGRPAPAGTGDGEQPQ